MSAPISNVRPEPDPPLVDIANYVADYAIRSDEAYATAHYCLLDTLGCGFEALAYPACTKLLGPIVPGTVVPNGARVPGTSYQLDPVQAAFNIGTMVRWLDFNDTWLAAEWGHPSDNLGGILATADWLSRTAIAAGKRRCVMRDVLTGMIKAHEIQGVLALENSFNRVGLDHVVLVKVASTAVVANMLGRYARRDHQRGLAGFRRRTDRCAPTGTRRTPVRARAGRRATPRARAVRLALIARTGEMGYPSALTRQDLGFLRRAVQGPAVQVPAALRQLRDGERAVQDLLPGGVPRPDSGRMRDAAASAECRIALADIETITIRTHESAMRIIDKKGPLDNPADRDHCLQYMMAVPLIFGRLTAEDYEDNVAADPRIDALREKMACVEDKAFQPRLSRSGKALDRQRDHRRIHAMAAEPAKSWSSIRSAIAAGARKACRC